MAYIKFHVSVKTLKCFVIFMKFIKDKICIIYM
jgi:hypothetical protein